MLSWFLNRLGYVKATAPEVTTEVRVVHRLSTEVYERLESALPRPLVGTTATGEHASFLLGVQATLKALREGIVV